MRKSTICYRKKKYFENDFFIDRIIMIETF